jgi:hypothetical protein
MQFYVDWSQQLNGGSFISLTPFVRVWEGLGVGSLLLGCSRRGPIRIALKLGGEFF